MAFRPLCVFVKGRGGIPTLIKNPNFPHCYGTGGCEKEFFLNSPSPLRHHVYKKIVAQIKVRINRCSLLA
jgi:hypothetical protein